VRNIGLADGFENHLKPKIIGFEDMKAEFTDMRITPGTDMALVIRQYKNRRQDARPASGEPCEMDIARLTR
jgi:hypothetical protein